MRLTNILLVPYNSILDIPQGLNEPEEISEEVDAMIFGLLFHDAMENIYKPFIGKMVNFEDVNAIINNQELKSETIISSFRNVYFRGIKEDEKIAITGRNWLIYEVVKKKCGPIIDCRPEAFTI